MKLNLGCGPHLIQGWINVDYALGARLARVPLLGIVTRRLGLFRTEWDPRIFIHDLTTDFPWPDGSVHTIYSSHMLEHLTRTQGRRFLARCHRVLRRGGRIRIVVPDLSNFVQQYLRGLVRADEFVEKLGVLPGQQRRGIRRPLAYVVEHPHKCMYDLPTLVEALQDTGFEASGRQPFESLIPDIHAIEQPDRVEGALIVEGSKP